MKRKSAKCEKGESKENKRQSTTCNELSVQREDNIWSLPLGQSKCNKEKNQSIDGNSIKTYDETHCVSTMFSPCRWISNCTPMKLTLIFYFRHDLLIYLFLVIYIPSYATLVQKDAKRRWHTKVKGNIRASNYPQNVAPHLCDKLSGQWRRSSKFSSVWITEVEENQFLKRNTVFSGTKFFKRFFCILSFNVNVLH